MKRFFTVLVVVTLVGFVGSASAQLTVGARLGLNMANISMPSADIDDLGGEFSQPVGNFFFVPLKIIQSAFHKFPFGSDEHRDAVNKRVNNDERLYVLAGRYHQAKDFAVQKGVCGPTGLVYISRPEVLAGIDGRGKTLFVIRPKVRTDNSTFIT